MQVVLLELDVGPGGHGVPEVLLAHRDDDLVDQRVAQPGDLCPRPDGESGAGRRIEVAELLAAGRGPHADDGVGIGDVRRGRAVGREVADRNLDGDGVDVGRGERVDAVGPHAGDQVGAGEGPQVAEVEDRAEVDVEALGPLAGEHDLTASGSVVTAAAASAA